MLQKIKLTVLVKDGQVIAIFSNRPERLELKVVDSDDLKRGDMIPETQIINFVVEKKIKKP